MALSAEAIANAAAKKMLLKGATPDQKKAINYFIPDTGCIGAIKNLLSPVKDEDYDKLVNKLVNESNSYKRAIDKIGLDESELQEIPPVTLYGFATSTDKMKVYSKVLDSEKYEGWGTYRSNVYVITHLFFSDTQVYMYQLTLNTMKNEKKERTEEYFYKDITNFSTTTDTEEAFKFKKGCFGGMDRVSTEVQKFGLIVPGDKFFTSTVGDIEPQVKAMKNKLREKKNA